MMYQVTVYLNTLSMHTISYLHSSQHFYFLSLSLTYTFSLLSLLKPEMSPEPYVLFFDSLNLVTFETFAWLSLFIATVAFILSPGGLAWACTKSSKSRVSIPGPSGSLAVFSRSHPHRVLAALAQRFKASHLMAFSVGFSRFVISSEPDTAKEILNSSAFADRPVKESAYELLFHRAMGFAPYGEYWRNLRRIASTHLFKSRVSKVLGLESV